MSFVTVAVNCWAAFVITRTEAGDRETEGGRNVMLTRLNAMLCVVESAWRNTPVNAKQMPKQPGSLGGVKDAGAVYVADTPLAVLVGDTVPQVGLQGT